MTVDRDWQSRKQPSPSVSTDEGMQIDESDVQAAKAFSPMHERWDSDSNMTVERDSQAQKQDSPSV
jgi:hypothetical protein